MPISVKVKSNDVAVWSKRQEIAETVISEFGDRFPDMNLLCFFDDEDCQSLRQEIGIANRGVFGPVESRKFCSPPWPFYVWDTIFVDDFPNSLECKQVFQQFIYLHGTTCRTEVGLIMTFAHELQHFVQYAHQRKLWAANTAVSMNFPREVLKSAGVKVFHIPIELEARITSKRIALRLCGTEIMNAYIETRIREATTEDDAEDWKFVRDLDLSAKCELSSGTIQLFQTFKPYRPQLEKVLRKLNEDRDFRNVDLAALI